MALRGWLCLHGLPGEAVRSGGCCAAADKAAKRGTARQGICGSGFARGYNAFSHLDAFDSWGTCRVPCTLHELCGGRD